MAVLAVAAGLRFVFPLLAGGGCGEQVRLDVAAAPDIAPAVQAAARDWIRTGADGARCVTVDVRAAESVDVASAVGREQRATFGGWGPGAAGVAVPQVWIADSSTWPVRLRAAVPGFTLAEQGRVAVSPVVFAAPEPVARDLGWSGGDVGYQDLTTQLTSSTTLRAGTVEPSRDAVGLSGLLALDAAAGSAGPRVLGGVLHALAVGRSALRANLVQQFPVADDPATLASGLGLAALSERDVVTYNAGSPSVRLSALYPRPAPATLDFPYLILPGASQGQGTAARALFRALGGATFRDQLGRLGLRGPDGAARGFTAPDGAPKVADPGAGPAPDAAAIVRALAGWSGVVAPARVLAVVDASGSMRAPDGTGRGTRMGAVLRAARDGLTLFSDDWQVGLWRFAGTRPGHQELVPIGPLAANRGAVEDALAGITAQDGDAGLYGTILDAYRTVQDGWQAGRVNSVVVLTDGVSAAGDLALSDLLTRLRSVKDDARPVQVVVVGVGDRVDRALLDQITRTVGGGVFVARDPAQVGDVFLQAISLRVAVAR
ncbi:VWA domain-containing protein [Krasilnikovia cinnamomea]|uniref:VWA domain-containing protein n=1 Tax=Krasilnikovia cinnamomea TaxID=349313 RepID=UPI00102AC25E|nr:VWA domain-containing protein [Krasilnikovia cinnamomea]